METSRSIGHYNDLSRCAVETVLLCAMKTDGLTADTVLLAAETQSGYALRA